MQKNSELLKEEILISQRSRAENFAKLKEKRMQRRDPLGIKRINKIIHDLRVKHGKFIKTEKKKEFKFAINEQTEEVEIVEKIKVKKDSKVKRAKYRYERVKQILDGYETIEEDDSIETIIQILDNINPLSQILHNQMKIRPWVTQIPCKAIDDAILIFVNNLSLIQGKKKVLEPKKYKKRLVTGFRETIRCLQSTLVEKQAKLIILPINLQISPLIDGSDHQVLKIIKLAIKNHIPIIHGSNRAKLGRAYCGKFGPKISVVTIINYQGQEELFNNLIQLQQLQSQLFIQTYPDVQLNSITEQILQI